MLQACDDDPTGFLRNWEIINRKNFADPTTTCSQCEAEPRYLYHPANALLCIEHANTLWYALQRLYPWIPAGTIHG